MTQWTDEEATFYVTKDERLAAVADAEGRGLTMKHDEYGVGAVVVAAADAIQADAEKGIEAMAAVAEVREARLTFGVRVDGPPDPVRARRQSLKAVMLSGKATAAETREALAMLL